MKKRRKFSEITFGGPLETADRAYTRGIVDTIRMYHELGVTLAETPEEIDAELASGPQALLKKIRTEQPGNINNILDTMQNKAASAVR